ncbi:MAG: exodeoxyribonuclease VII small subunit [Clostridia bacterium]|nr:exodeoxyribonuclease VII small subunit [Clostridia bacterium]
MSENAKPQEGFEQKLARLEEVTRALENSSTALDDSLKLFEEGVRLVRECTSLLENAERRVKMLARDPETGEVVETDMPPMSAT